jgi:hypothetical protein
MKMNALVAAKTLASLVLAQEQSATPASTSRKNIMTAFELAKVPVEFVYKFVLLPEFRNEAEGRGLYDVTLIKVDDAALTKYLTRGEPKPAKEPKAPKPAKEPKAPKPAKEPKAPKPAKEAKPGKKETKSEATIPARPDGEMKWEVGTQVTKRPAKATKTVVAPEPPATGVAVGEAWLVTPEATSADAAEDDTVA